jgi:hypothetical protein
MATDVYIDPQWTGTKSGTVSEPYDDFPGTLNSNYNYWLKRGSFLERSTQVNFSNLQNVTVGAYYVVDGVAHYDASTLLPRPKWSCHEVITGTGSFTHLGSDVWEYDDSSGQLEYYRVLGLGRIGDMHNPSWRERAVYAPYGGSGTGSGFDTYGQWDYSSGANSSKFAIYSPQDPYTEFGNIYFVSTIRNPVLRISCTSTATENFTVQDIHFLRGGEGVRIYNNSIYSEDVTITNCVFDHCSFGINMLHGTGVGASTINTRIVNNYFNECGCVGIHLGGLGASNHGDYISNNTILNTGGAECIGGIYGPVNGDGSGTEAFTIIENNYVDTVYDVTQYWDYEQRCIYLESGSTRAIVRNNVCVNSFRAGIHINTGSGPNYVINNLIVDCGVGMEDSDASDRGNTTPTENYYIGNTTVRCKESAFKINRLATSTDSGKVILINNIFDGIEGTTSAGAVNLDADADDLGILETPDFCVANNYDNLVTRANSTSGLLTTAGDNFVSADPLLDQTTYEPAPGSPCRDAGCGVSYPYDVYGIPANGNNIGAVWPVTPSSKERR